VDDLHCKAGSRHDPAHHPPFPTRSLRQFCKTAMLGSAGGACARRSVGSGCAALAARQGQAGYRLGLPALARIQARTRALSCATVGRGVVRVILSLAGSLSTGLCSMARSCTVLSFQGMRHVPECQGCRLALHQQWPAIKHVLRTWRSALACQAEQCSK